MAKKPTYEELTQRIKELEQNESERKRVEEALRKSEESFRAVTENANDGIIVSADDGTHVYANQRASDITGYSIDELLKIGLKGLAHPDEIPKLSGRLKKRLAGEEAPIQYETTFIDKNGKKLPVEISAAKTYWHGQTTDIVIIRDITDRKRMEEELQNSRNMLQTVLDTIPSAVFWKDRDLNYLGGNRGFLAVVGLKSSEEVIGKSDFDFPWTKGEADSFREFDRKVIESGIPEYNIVEPYTRFAGTQAWAKTNKVPLKDTKGNVIGVLGTYEDITELKRSDESMKESEKKYRNLIESLQEGIWLIDEDAYTTFVNPPMAEMLGYTVDEMQGKHLFDFMDEKSIEIASKKLESRRSGIKEQHEFEFRRKDGASVFTLLETNPINDKEGNYTGSIAGVIDITERKRMEEELLRSQKLESVGILAGGIAHDFNNILTAIVGNISLAKNQVTPEDEIFDLLNEVEMASTRAQTLTKQLLTFAKGGTPVKETASIKDIIKESALFALRGSKSNCEFSISEDLWPVEVDVGQFNQIINNIVINATQAMPLGGTIKVAVENLIIGDRKGLPIKPGRYIGISIMDQGIGIAEEHLLHIFDPYFTTKQEGSGLGLATTYSIIKRHDGHIKVESQLRVGTTIHIYLPASEKAIPEKEEVQLIKGHGRILVMDDEDSLRRIVGRILDNLGYESEFAKDGSEAIEMVKKAKETGKFYDAVILDLTVPGGMGGKECITKLLEIDPGIKGIVSSGYSEDPVLANFQEYGFKGMIPKPFESVLLSKVLHEVLKG